MKPACTIAVLTLLLAGAMAADAQSLDLLRMLAEKSWIGVGPHHRWERGPRIDLELGTTGLGSNIKPQVADDDNSKPYFDDDLRASSEKRSAVATALNAGRRRRQPAPALGKAVSPYVGVGVLNDVGSFFDSLRDNLETLAMLSPHERATLFQEPPHVVQAPRTTSGGGGGSGIVKLHPFKPMRPGYIRSYNRRSFVEADGGYPGANHHDPGLLWTGLGRR